MCRSIAVPAGRRPTAPCVHNVPSRAARALKTRHYAWVPQVAEGPDPFKHPPLVPSEWRLLRGLVQVLLVVAILIGLPTVLSPPITRSTPGVYGVPLALILIGWYVRRHRSRVLGTLIIASMTIHLVGWIAMYLYARWVFRDGWELR